MGKPEGKRTPGRHRYRREDTITRNLQKVSWDHGVDRLGSGYGRVTG